MKNYRWLVTGVALALAGVMAFAELGWAQCRGYGPRGRDYQMGQTGWRGRGAGYANYPNYYAGAGYGAQGGGYARGIRNSRWGGRDNCPYYPAYQAAAIPAGQIPR